MKKGNEPISNEQIAQLYQERCKEIKAKDAEIARLKEECAINKKAAEHYKADIENYWHGSLKQAREEASVQAAHIELLRGALLEIANRVNNEGDDSQATVSDCGHIAREALSSSKDSVLEEVRLTERVITMAEAVKMERDGCLLTNTQIKKKTLDAMCDALEALAAHQKRGSR